VSDPVWRGRHRSRHHRRQHVAATVLALACLVSLAAWWVALPSYSPFLSGIAQSNSVWAQGDPSRNLALLAGRAAWAASGAGSARVVYPYSVVPGGVRTAQELEEASEHDPVVHGHYAQLDFKRAEVVQLKQAKWVYVSYRMGDKVFWTKRKVRLHRGERLISDGRISARTRCANRVSETPQAPVSPEEPPAEKLDRAVNVPLLLADFDSVLLPPETAGIGPFPSPPGGGGFPPIFPPPIPPGGCDPHAKNSACPPTPPVPVPEPETILLIPWAAGAIYVAYRRAAVTKQAYRQHSGLKPVA